MSGKSTIKQEYVGLPDGSTYCGYSVFTLREKIAAGELPAYRMTDKPGGRIRIKLSDLDALMKPVLPAEITATAGGAR